MDDNNAVALVDQWFVDFYVHLIWKQFEQHGRIESGWVREFVVNSGTPCGSGILDRGVQKVDIVDVARELRNRLLIELMYKLSSGDAESEQSDPTKQTTLEEAIDVFDRLLTTIVRCDFREISGSEVSRMKLLLKQQAVLVCCRNKAFDLASAVFGRQWAHWKNETEMRVRQEISDVIAQRHSVHAYSILNPYSALIDCCRTILRSIFNSFKTPFLVVAAKSVWLRYNQLMQSETSAFDEQNQIDVNNEIDRFTTDAVDKQESARSAVVCPSDDNSENDQSVMEHDEIYVRHEAKVSPHKQIISPITQLERASPTSTSNDKQTIPESHLDSFFLDEDVENLGHSTPSKKQTLKRKAWLPEEEEKIYVGVQKYGIGQWKKIAEFLGSARSNVDVKDKWRTMIKQNKLRRYEALYGPV